MGLLTEKHPEKLRDAIKTAGAQGRKAATVRLELQAGTFPGWPHEYDMPLGTIRYYLREGRKDHARNSVSPTAKEGLRPGVDALALRIFGQLEDELKIVERQKTRDMDRLGKVLDGLLKLSKLAPDAKPEQPRSKARAVKKDDPPADPLAAALMG